MPHWMLILNPETETGAGWLWKQAVTKLMELAPPTATLVTQGPNGREEQEVPSALIQRNDLLKVRFRCSCLVVARACPASSNQ